MSSNNNSLSNNSDSMSDSASESSEYADCNIGNELVGEIVGNRYILLHKIGSGAFASVWFAYYINDPSKKFYYAIKVQLPEDYSSGLDEISFLTKIKSKNNDKLSYLYERFEYHNNSDDDPMICMVFDLLACSSYQLIRRGKYSDGLPENTVLDITKQLLEGLKDIHEMNIIHTDIKPENLLIKGLHENTIKWINEYDKINISQIYNEILAKEKNESKISLKNEKNLKRIKDKSRQLLKEIMLKNINQIGSLTTGENISSFEIIADNNIDNIEIVISDYGTAYKNNEVELGLEIQTRYYRAPEIILGCYCDNKCDIWSIGCTIYELFTGEILFDPSKDSKFDRDVHHIYWIIEIIDDIPLWMIKKTYDKNKFFDKNNKLKVKSPDPWRIRDILQEKEKDLNNPNIIKLLNIIQKCLIIDPKIRPSASQLLNEFF